MTDIHVLRGDNGLVTWHDLKLEEHDLSAIFSMLTKNLAIGYMCSLQEASEILSGFDSPTMLFAELLQQRLHLNAAKRLPPLS